MRTVTCPILKFQVVNEVSIFAPQSRPCACILSFSLFHYQYCNKHGGDIVDAFMKVVGVKMKKEDGKITHSQYVRVNLVESEHPFFSRVWHGVHVLDETSQLLSYDARKKIQDNGGVWPKQWLRNPQKIRKKLDFHSLVSLPEPFKPWVLGYITT